MNNFSKIVELCRGLSFLFWMGSWEPKTQRTKKKTFVTTIKLHETKNQNIKTAQFTKQDVYHVK